MTGGNINLLVRADDIGLSHASNLACIDVFKNGIARSVEIMAPGPWFPHAVRLLRETPGYDVGVHLVLTSEWDDMKCRPLSEAKSLVTEDGYFYRAFRPAPHYPGTPVLQGAAWTPEDVEQELRAQIEVTLRHLPAASHMSFHMGGLRDDPRFAAVVNKLGSEYGLLDEIAVPRFERVRGFGKNGATLTPEEKTRALIAYLEALAPGNWLFVDHPAYDTPEMRAMSHRGYENMALDRQGVTTAWTNEEVKAVIRRRGIRLVSYAEIRDGAVK